MPSRDAAFKSLLQCCTEALQNEMRDIGITITAHAGADCWDTKVGSNPTTTRT
jgi:hypothetical protein